jgi:hypothetical protein
MLISVALLLLLLVIVVVIVIVLLHTILEDLCPQARVRICLGGVLLFYHFYYFDPIFMYKIQGQTLSLRIIIIIFFLIGKVTS